MTTSDPSTAEIGPIQGRVHGGQQPVVGAHVYLYAVGTEANAGNGITPSTGNASVSLLNSSGSNVASDGTNYYVTTDSNGDFSITGDYTCVSGQQIYLYAVGGNTGGGTNSSAAFLAGVGACPAGGTTLPTNAFYYMNEVTTVATAYALAGYASDALHISADSTGSVSSEAELAATGIANAMANVSNLVDLSTGTALATTPGGNGTPPQDEIDTLANILASCVNSSDTSPGDCNNLFSVSKSGGSTGTTPTDTATAAINIAHNAGENVAALYAMQTGVGAPFLPALSTQRSDFGVAITFSGSGAASPKSVAIDAQGNVWGVSTGDLVNFYSPLGVPLAAAGLATATTTPLNALAIDVNGNAWAEDTAGNLTEFGPTGETLSPSGGVSNGGTGTAGLTSDSFGYLWSANNSSGTVFRFDPNSSESVANYTVDAGSHLVADSAGYLWLPATDGKLYQLNQAGATVATYSSLYATPTAITVDSTDAVYIADASRQHIARVGSDGTTSQFADGVGGAQALAVDGANNLWVAANVIAEMNSSGAVLSGADFHLPTGTITDSIAVDGSGDLWVADTTENGGPGSHYTEYLGLAAPAVTPASYATTHGVQRNALNLTIGFNGPDVQFPYETEFYTSTNAYYQSIGLSYPAGARYCQAYLSWDVAEQPVGSGPVGTEGSRAWFEDWLSHAEGNCDRALVTFKFISGVTVQGTSYPSPADYETAIEDFLNTDWSYTGWTGAIDFTAWNEPQAAGTVGDGLTSTQIPAENAADYYLALRKHCVPTQCLVAAFNFGSNGNEWEDYIQNCTDDAATLCSNASYMDEYKHYIVTDAPNYGFTSSFRPEIASYHGWDDVNNYINSASQCTDPQRCTIRAFVTALSDGSWVNAELWDTEVAAGQDPESDPTPTVQACAASFLLNLTGSVSNRFTRLYYTQPYVSTGNYFSLFDSSGNPDPAYYVMVDRNIAYTPPSGSTCP